jgi:spore coat polysaccharide biosynthesis protein SpsF
MRVGCLINARLASKRLPKKHLRDIAGKLALERILERLMPCDDVVFIIATGAEQENKPLEAIAKEHKIAIFYGNQQNIPQRHLDAAREHKLDAIISVDGDDVLTSPTAFKDVLAALQAGKSLVRTEGLPFGMNILYAYTTETLVKAIQTAKKDGGSFDTGWGWIWDGMPIHRIMYDIWDAEKIRMTMDYPEDLRFFRTVFELCDPDILTDDSPLCSWIVKNRVHKINKRRH